MLTGIILILAGILAAASLVTKKVKDAQKLIDVLVPFQGWIGVVLFIWGVWGIISSILTIGWIGTSMWWMIWWITSLAVALIETVIGFMMGYGLIAKYALSKNEEAKAKGEEVLAKLATYQTTVGLISIGVGIWAIIWRIVG